MQFEFVWGHLKHNPIINQTENKKEHSSPSSTVDLNLSVSIRAWFYVGQLRNAPCDTECKIIPKCSEWGLFFLFLLTWCVKHGSVRRDKALPCSFSCAALSRSLGKLQASEEAAGMRFLCFTHIQTCLSSLHLT